MGRPSCKRKSNAILTKRLPKKSKQAASGVTTRGAASGRGGDPAHLHGKNARERRAGVRSGKSCEAVQSIKSISKSGAKATLKPGAKATLQAAARAKRLLRRQKGTAVQQPPAPTPHPVASVNNTAAAAAAEPAVPAAAEAVAAVPFPAAEAAPPPGAVADLCDASAFVSSSRLAQYEWLLGRPAVGELAVGTAVWVKMEYFCPWPAVVFSLRHVLRSEVADLLASYPPGAPAVLVHFYGEHNHAWVASESLDGFIKLSLEQPEAHQALMARLAKWAHRNKRDSSVATTLAELGGVLADPGAEAVRVRGLRDQQLAAAEEEEERQQREHEREQDGGEEASARDGPPPRRGHTHRQEDGSSDDDEGEERGAGGPEGKGSGKRAKPEAAAPDVGAPWRRCLYLCAACGERGGQVRCGGCRRAYHTLCLERPAVCPADLPPGYSWTCARCSAVNTEGCPGTATQQHRDENGGKQAPDGLTPDSVIYAAAFDVFELQKPTADCPYIRGLLDPCTNCKRNPNIPAEKLYNIHDNGLLESNSWEGYYVILNPSFVAEIQWRFINRAIDEVERGRVPAVVLVCRNSTDTAFFQRLRPYPRVLMRRTHIQFKDYPKTPIGFGIVIFCLAQPGPDQAGLYRRFVDAFSAWGEPNIPIDRALMESAEFPALLARLTDYTQRHLRDTWVQCGQCDKWRIVPYDTYLRISRDPDHKWTCTSLGLASGCGRPQSRAEASGGQYAPHRGAASAAGGASRWRRRAGAPTADPQLAAAPAGQADSVTIERPVQPQLRRGTRKRKATQEEAAAAEQGQERRAGSAAGPAGPVAPPADEQLGAPQQQQPPLQTAPRLDCGAAGGGAPHQGAEGRPRRPKRQKRNEPRAPEDQVEACRGLAQPEQLPSQQQRQQPGQPTPERSHEPPASGQPPSSEAGVSTPPPREVLPDPLHQPEGEQRQPDQVPIEPAPETAVLPPQQLPAQAPELGLVRAPLEPHRPGPEGEAATGPQPAPPPHAVQAEPHLGDTQLHSRGVGPGPMTKATIGTETMEVATLSRKAPRHEDVPIVAPGVQATAAAEPPAATPPVPPEASPPCAAACTVCVPGRACPSGEVPPAPSLEVEAPPQPASAIAADRRLHAASEAPPTRRRGSTSAPSAAAAEGLPPDLRLTVGAEPDQGPAAGACGEGWAAGPHHPGFAADQRGGPGPSSGGVESPSCAVAGELGDGGGWGPLPLPLPLSLPLPPPPTGGREFEHQVVTAGALALPAAGDGCDAAQAMEPPLASRVPHRPRTRRPAARSRSALAASAWALGLLGGPLPLPLPQPVPAPSSLHRLARSPLRRAPPLVKPPAAVQLGDPPELEPEQKMPCPDVLRRPPGHLPAPEPAQAPPAAGQLGPPGPAPGLQTLLHAQRIGQPVQLPVQQHPRGRQRQRGPPPMSALPSPLLTPRPPPSQPQQLQAPLKLQLQHQKEQVALQLQNQILAYQFLRLQLLQSCLQGAKAMGPPAGALASAPMGPPAGATPEAPGPPVQQGQQSQPRPAAQHSSGGEAVRLSPADGQRPQSLGFDLPGSRVQGSVAAGACASWSPNDPLPLPSPALLQAATTPPQRRQELVPSLNLLASMPAAAAFVTAPAAPAAGLGLGLGLGGDSQRLPASTCQGSGACGAHQLLARVNDGAAGSSRYPPALSTGPPAAATRPPGNPPARSPGHHGESAHAPETALLLANGASHQVGPAGRDCAARTSTALAAVGQLAPATVRADAANGCRPAPAPAAAAAPAHLPLPALLQLPQAQPEAGALLQGCPMPAQRSMQCGQLRRPPAPLVPPQQLTAMWVQAGQGAGGLPQLAGRPAAATLHGSS